MTSNPPPPKAGQALRLDNELGIVTADGRNSIPWPEHFSSEDWDATKSVLDSYSSLLASHERLKQALMEARTSMYTDDEMNRFHDQRLQHTHALDIVDAALSTAHSVNKG